MGKPVQPDPQLGLFDRKVRARARSTDPSPSHAAARRVEASGEAAAQRAKALAIVTDHPGHTSRELALLSGMDRYALARRLPELRAENAVHTAKTRECE